MIRAVISVSVHKAGRFAGGLAVHQTSPRVWRQDEVDLVRLVADRCWEALERARALRELRESEEALREADRRKDEFLATLAHELRNPLAPIRTGVELLKVSPTGAVAAKACSVMERQLGHMVRLIDDLLDVARVSRGTFELKCERVRVQTVLDHALETSLPLIEAAGHSLTIDIAEPPLVLLGDLTRLAQVVSNLLDNAAKYTPPGGRITISARHVGDAALICVADSGQGIPADMLTRVFDLFTQIGRTTDRAQGGLGIGLSLVRNLVEMHGGRVWVESPGAGQGSTFSLRIPLLDDEDGRTREPASSPGLRAHAAPGGGRVLVVDDNIDAAETLAMLVDHDGHDTRTAYTGPEAVEAAREFRPEVVFLDLGLPGMDGYEVATVLRREPGFERTLIIAVTGWGSDEDRRRSELAGFDAHRTKPVEASAVRRVLARLSARS